MDNRICDYCGDEFNPHNFSRKRFCSPRCRVSYHGKKNVRDKKRKAGVQGFIARRCPECKLLFVTNNINRKYCSDLHREEYRRKIRLTQHYTLRDEQIICKYIYDSKDDPGSISDLIEDLSGISCDRKIRDEKEGRETKSSGRESWEISSTPCGREKKCIICGSVRDRNGKYCIGCWKAMGKRRYISHVIKALGKMDITIEQKRRCLPCCILPTCIEAGNVHDGCDTIFKLLRGEAKKKMRSLTRVTRQKQGG